MQRGSDRLSFHKDDEMKHELKGLIRSGRPTRIEEWHDPEPGADDDPRVPTGNVPSGETDEVSLRFELARHLGRSAFPAKRGTLVHDLADKHAPDDLTDMVRGLPSGHMYHNVQEVVDELRRESAPRE